MKRSYTVTDAVRERGRKGGTASNSPAARLKRVAALTPEEIAAGARALTPEEAAKIRAMLATVPATTGGDDA